MLSIMRLKYYWVGMTRDIREYVLSCPKCQEVKSMTGVIVPITVQYSKYVITWPARDLQASSLVRKFHKQVICVYGTPRKLVSDNGSAFASALF